MATYYVETPWDTAPDNTSVYKIHPIDDFWLLGNGVDPIQKYDTVYIADLKGYPPKGNIFQVYKNRLMVAGDPSFPHRVWYSHLGNAEGWSKNTDWNDIYPEDGGKINGLGIQNDELIISKDNGRLYGWKITSDGTPETSSVRIIEDDRGQVGRRAGITSRDVRYYLGRGLMDTVPASTKSGGLSYIIEEVVKAIDDTVLEQTAMGAKSGKIYAAIGSVTFTAGTELAVNNTVIGYDIANDAFFLRDDMNAKVFTRFIDPNTKIESLYFGDANGRVFKIDDGTTAGNNPIQMMIRTKNYFADLEHNVVVSKVGVMMNQPDNTSITYRIRSEEEYERVLGQVDAEPIWWENTDGEEGPFFSLQFTHNGTTARPALLGYVLVYQEAGRNEPTDE